MKTKLCECGCGRPAPIALRADLRNGYKRGDAKRFISGHNARMKRGHCRTPEYRAYSHAKERCENPRCKDYDNYGGRGIRFLFASFAEFLVELGPRPTPAHSVDRKDNEGHYAPGNLRWATHSAQMKNRMPRWAATRMKRLEDEITRLGGKIPK